MTNEENLRAALRDLRDSVEWRAMESVNSGESETVTHMWMVFESMIRKFLKKHRCDIDG